MQNFLDNHPFWFVIITLAIVFWNVAGAALFLDKLMSPLNNWNRRQTIFAAIVAGPVTLAIVSLEWVFMIATAVFLYFFEKLK